MLFFLFFTKVTTGGINKLSLLDNGQKPMDGVCVCVCARVIFVLSWCSEKIHNHSLST